MIASPTWLASALEEIVITEQSAPPYGRNLKACARARFERFATQIGSVFDSELLELASFERTRADVGALAKAEHARRAELER